MSTLAEIEAMVAALSLAEQEELLNRLIAKLGCSAVEFPLREDHVTLLNERFTAYRRKLRGTPPEQMRPVLTSTWDEVKRRFTTRGD